MVSMKDIAAECGVSVATVSKALNNHKDIGEETKETIRKKAKELGYLPNLSARALKTNKTNNIGVLFADASRSGLTHDYFANVLDQFRSAAEEKGYDITFLNCNKTRPGRMSYYEHSLYRGFDGVVIACIDFADPEVAELMKGKTPVVAIDYMTDLVNSVNSDNTQGMRDLTEYIVKDMGHRKVAYIYGDENSTTAVTHNRLTSFLGTMEENGIQVPPEYIKQAAYRDIKAAAKYTEQLLALEDPPTCILYPDDFAAIGGLNVIHAHGLRIPEDISVAGYDGLDVAAQYEPRLTTVRQDTAIIGRMAADKLVEMIERPQTMPLEHITVSCILERGNSVGKMSKS